MSQLIAQLTTPNVLVFVLALVVLLGAMRVKPLWQRSSVKVKNNSGNVTVINNMSAVPSHRDGKENSPGNGLSFLADILQVVGFAILLLQISGIIR
ncbi:MAG: hypothetical protein ABL985_18255 [Casimicrobium sp.]